MCYLNAHILWCTNDLGSIRWRLLADNQWLWVENGRMRKKRWNLTTMSAFGSCQSKLSQFKKFYFIFKIATRTPWVFCTSLYLCSFENTFHKNARKYRGCSQNFLLTLTTKRIFLEYAPLNAVQVMAAGWIVHTMLMCLPQCWNWGL